MRSIGNDPLKTKKQLKRSALTSVLLASMVSVFPLIMYADYRKYGFIYTGKGRVFTASGDEALIITYGVAGAACLMWVMAACSFVRSMMKIKRGEYSEIDEAPEFVICSNCGEPQNSKDLLAGHCHKCTGNVESLEGYYDRHPELKPELQATASRGLSQGGASEYITCTKCGKTYCSEDCLDSVCRDCRTM